MGGIIENDAGKFVLVNNQGMVGFPMDNPAGIANHTPYVDWQEVPEHLASGQHVDDFLDARGVARKQLSP